MKICEEGIFNLHIFTFTHQIDLTVNIIFLVRLTLHQNHCMPEFLLSFILFSFQFVANAQQDAVIKNGDSFIHYKTFGSGKPILIINGGPGMNSDGFDGIAKMLSKNNMTITYDQRGTGRSTVEKIDNTTISMDLMVNDIEVLRKYLKIDQWIIFGHSFGGMLAAYYATVHPENIKSIIFSSSGGIDLGLLSGLNIESNYPDRKLIH